MVETAEARGVKSCGHNSSQAPLAPKGFITGAEYKWETIYKIYADGFRGFDYSGAAAQSIILMCLVMALTFIQFRYIERRVHYT